MSRHATIRLVFPQWQGGANPDYAFGAELLALIVPPSSNAKTIEIPCSRDFDERDEPDAEIAGTRGLLTQAEVARIVLDMHTPDRTIVLGGDCSVSQVPFDYMHGRYPEHTGLIWLDAHPDVASVKDSNHLHEMVLANLMGRGAREGAPGVLAYVEHPFAPEDVLFAGLVESDLRPMDHAVRDLGMRVVAPEDLERTGMAICEWIKERGLKQVLVHWDLDVLAPSDFRSILPGEPHTDPASFGAAVGRMTIAQVVRTLRDISVYADIVGLTLAEHMPWDAIRLRNELASVPIFQD